MPHWFEKYLVWSLYIMQPLALPNKKMVSNKCVPLAAGDQSIANPSWLCCVSTWTRLTCLGSCLFAASESSTMAVGSVMSWMYTEPTSDQVPVYTFPLIFATWEWTQIKAFLLILSIWNSITYISYKTRTFNSSLLIKINTKGSWLALERCYTNTMKTWVAYSNSHLEYK